MFDVKFFSFVLLAEGCGRVGHYGLHKIICDEERESEM